MIRKNLRIKHMIIFYCICLCYHFCCFAEEEFERRLEKNIDRIKIENYLLLERINGSRGLIPVIFIYCYNEYYPLYATKIDYKKIGRQRYFFNYKVGKDTQPILTTIADKNMKLDDFISKYLIKDEDSQSYEVSDMGYGPFVPEGMKGSILFAAQYNYDFLILSESSHDWDIRLYLPDAYEYVIKKYNIPVNKNNTTQIIIVVVLSIVCIFIWGNFKVHRRRK